MRGMQSRPCAAFADMRLIACGSLVDVALAVKAMDIEQQTGQVLVFDEATGAVIDLDLRGTSAEIAKRLTEQEAIERRRDSTVEETPKRGRGRPKLGVVAREVTLLPRHWEWLAAQAGSASQVLRRLVEQARQADKGETKARTAQEAAYRFLTAIAGDLPGYEEAMRALFAADRARFDDNMSDWPKDIRTYALRLAFGRTEGGTDTTP